MLGCSSACVCCVCANLTFWQSKRRGGPLANPRLGEADDDDDDNDDNVVDDEPAFQRADADTLSARKRVKPGASASRAAMAAEGPLGNVAPPPSTGGLFNAFNLVPAGGSGAGAAPAAGASGGSALAALAGKDPFSLGGPTTG